MEYVRSTEYLRLIELVRKARKLDLNWIAIDADNSVYYYNEKPESASGYQWVFNGRYCVRYDKPYKLTGGWKAAIIEVAKIRETG